MNQLPVLSQKWTALSNCQLVMGALSRTTKATKQLKGQQQQHVSISECQSILQKMVLCLIELTGTERCWS